ncbi:MAG: M24 family metallopeptidase [Anaerolineae bacterium]
MTSSTFETADIIHEKTGQAIEILQDQGVDLWLTFVRETSQVKDPTLDLLVGFDLTWPSALLIHRNGERLAIVGRYDVPNLEKLGAYTEVIGYDESIEEALVGAIRRLKPRQIAVNYSESDPAADGLTYGMFRKLSRMLASTPYCSRLISAEQIIGKLRGRKSPAELALIREAVLVTEAAFEDLTAWLRPGLTEVEIAAFLHDYATKRHMDTSWEWEYCPIVNVSPDAEVGHRLPGEYTAAPGHLVHVDFGVSRSGFVSDLQRTWYLRENSETTVPVEVQKAWEAVTAALEAGRAALKPGARGWEVDAAARSTLVEAGYAEYLHAFGHHIGRTAHDGATVLGPRWERYGSSVEGVIEAGNVFAIELGAVVPGRGYVGREENVVITEDGAAYISTPQEGIWLV